MYLLYCIFQSSDAQKPSSFPGVGDQPVFPVTINGISAAVSEISDAHLIPDVPRVMAYQKVIASFHRDRTVIPMRYGGVLRDRPRVITFLQENTPRYELLLKELDGCSEMGIRLIMEDARLSIAGVSSHNPAAGISGKAYLAARKDHYAREDGITEAKNEIVRQLRAALAGLFVKCRVGMSPIRHHHPAMLSLDFLVPAKSIDTFRQVFRNMHRGMETTKLLLSGPWPPYNFVLPDNEQRRPEPPDEARKKGEP